MEDERSLDESEVADRVGVGVAFDGVGVGVRVGVSLGTEIVTSAGSSGPGSAIAATPIDRAIPTSNPKTVHSAARHRPRMLDTVAPGDPRAR